MGLAPVQRPGHRLAQVVFVIVNPARDGRRHDVTCYCISCMPDQPLGYGGYTDLLTTFEFYRDHSNLRGP